MCIVYNDETYKTGVTVIAAAYNGGEMESVKIFDMTADGDIDFGNYTDGNGRELKLFIWNSINGMIPIGRVYTNADIK